MLPFDFEEIVHCCTELSWPLSTLLTDRRHSGHSAPSWLLGSFMAFPLPPDGVLSASYKSRTVGRDVGLGRSHILALVSLRILQHAARMELTAEAAA